VKAGEVLRGLRIHIAKSGVITGRVLDTNGRPVFRARVAAMRKFYDENGTAGLTLTRNSGTDDRGEYRVFGLEAGEYYVFVDSVPLGEVSTIPTYFPGTSEASQASPVVVKVGDEIRLADLTLPSQKGASIRLHIENMTGQTPQLMNVEVRKDGVTVANRGIPSPMAMDVFSLNSLSPGIYEFAVGLYGTEGFTFSHASVRLDDSSVDANVTVHKGWQVNGRIEAQSLDGTRRPLAGVQVMLGTPHVNTQGRVRRIAPGTGTRIRSGRVHPHSPGRRTRYSRGRNSYHWGYVHSCRDWHTRWSNQRHHRQFR
jgi:hypothetical protein